MSEELTNTTGQGESTDPEVTQPEEVTLQEKLDAYYTMTGLKLELLLNKTVLIFL